MGIFSRLAARFKKWKLKQELLQRDEEELLIYLSEGIKELEKVKSLCVTLNLKNYYQSSIRKKLRRRLLQAKIWFEKALEVEKRTRVINSTSMETINKGSLRMKILTSKEAAFASELNMNKIIFSCVSELNSLFIAFPDQSQQFIRTVVEMVFSMRSLKEDIEKLIALEKKVVKIYYESGGS